MSNKLHHIYNEPVKMTLEINSMAPAKKTQKGIKLVPPDGGWGWMVLIGTAVCNIFNQSMLSLFSLLYGDALEAMGHTTQGAAVVLSTMLFVSNFGGPIAGALVKLISPRFVATIGACLSTLGIFLSGFSSNIIHLILSYGILLGLGLGFIQNSSFVAINSYFKLKKSRAVGLANVGTGVGQTLMPHLVRYLLENYGFQGACLILSSLSLHGICGTLLLQPVEWHMKKIEEEIPVGEKQHILQNNNKDADDEVFKINKIGNKSDSQKQLEKMIAANSNRLKDDNKFLALAQKKSLLSKIYDLFDISLLSSPRFLNIILGTALCTTSLQNFSMLYPFFLQKMALLNKADTAMCMSAISAADIVGRLVLPTFQDKYKIKSRWMLIMTSVWLVTVRQILAYQTNLQFLIIMSCLYGFGRSVVIICRNIAPSENCTLEQVPAAVGLNMLAMGIIVPPTGYLLGWIRDYTNSYIICITAQNTLFIIVLATWIPDMLCLWMKERKENKNGLSK